MVRKEPNIKINVRRSEQVKERLDRVSKSLDAIGRGEYAEIISDDEKMLNLAPKMISSIGKAKFIRTWSGDDGYFHTLVEKE